jgi:manganese transport protein
MTHINFFESRGWLRSKSGKSLEEVHRSVSFASKTTFWRKMLAFAGPGFLVAVGYMDPGNWATDLAGGAKFGYTLLSVVFLSNLMAILLQFLSAKLGIVTGRDLAQACRDSYSKPVAFMLWILAEIAIIACDLAEVIGSAIALNLLFGIPIMMGILITAVDVLILLALQHKGFRYLEALVVTLIGTIIVCFGIEIWLSHPNTKELFFGMIPTWKIVANREMLYIAVGILGATVMPHNLYLHSALVQTRDYEETEKGKKEALFFASIDSSVALFLAFFVNAAILVTAAATFHTRGMGDVTEIQDAYKLLAPFLGTSAASIVFALALLASGQNSTITGTLAGQIVMEGFVDIKIKPWLRRLVTRLIAIVPAIAVVYFLGERGLTELLVLSQVVLSIQLSFAVFPLVHFTSDKEKMGSFRNNLLVRFLAYFVAITIASLNAWLLFATFFPQ